MRNVLVHLFAGFITAAFLFGCAKQLTKEEVISNELMSVDKMEKPILISYNKQANPYAVSNMLRAYASLSGASSVDEIKKASGITATHYYVKFTPQDYKEEGVLKHDSTLILYTHPIDNEYWEGANDIGKIASIADDDKRIYYSSVPINSKLPNIGYEILDELFIPDDYSENRNKPGISTNISKADKINSIDVEELVSESFRLTGNLNNENSGGVILARSSWRPSGRIRAFDDTPGINTLVGVEGIKVKARRWFTTHTGFTDGNGYYSCDGTFKRPADYSFDWERYDFQINNAGGNLASVSASNIEGSWNVDFNSTSWDRYYAAAFRAAFYYYYRDRKGLRPPPENGFWNTQLKIKADPGSDPDGNSAGNHNPARRFLGLGSAIHLYCWNRNTRQIFATTIHELAHASHWNMSSGGDYTNSEDVLAESWARGVERELTRMTYSTYNPSYWRFKDGDPAPNYFYTGVVEDMIDGINGYDQVEGYTIRQLEDALVGQRGWYGWLDNIKNMHNNPTENNLNDLFGYWY